MTRVLEFTDPRAQDVKLSGPGMAVLAQIARAGVPLPAGFIVTSECGVWDDPDAEAAVYRGYHTLGDEQGEVPLLTVIASTPPEVPAVTRHGISTLAELFIAIDECRGGPEENGSRPYYNGPAATFVPVGVFVTQNAVPS